MRCQAAAIGAGAFGGGRGGWGDGALGSSKKGLSGLLGRGWELVRCQAVWLSQLSWLVGLGAGRPTQAEGCEQPPVQRHGGRGVAG